MHTYNNDCMDACICIKGDWKVTSRFTLNSKTNFSDVHFQLMCLCGATLSHPSPGKHCLQYIESAICLLSDSVEAASTAYTNTGTNTEM